MRKLKVYMFVYNNCKHDVRVLKEARTLTEAGYDVQIIAVLDKETAPYEEKQGFKIIRVKKDPIHYRILRSLRHPSIGVKAFFKLIVLPAEMFVSFCMLLLSKTGGKKKTKEALSIKGFARRLQDLLTGFFLHTAHFVKKKHIFFRVFKIGFKLAKKISRIIVKAYKKMLRAIMRAYVKSLVYAFKKILMLFHRPLCFWDYYRRSYHIVKQNPADIYHAHDLNTLPVAWWAKKKLGGKLVYDSHELFVERNRLKEASMITKWLMHRVEGFLVKCADEVITINESYANILAKWYGIRAPHVVKNTPQKLSSKVRHVDLHRLLNINSNIRILIYSGAITFGRGLESIIEGLKFLSGVHFVILGYGREEYKLKLIRIAQECSVDRNITFLGPVDAHMVPAYIAGANLGVAPIINTSLSYYYCLPNKLFEYIAAGIPVAASDFPELRKVVLGHELGAVFDPEDPKDIARAIDFILSDPERYQRMKENARKAARIYNWENESKKLLTLYAELTEEKK